MRRPRAITLLAVVGLLSTLIAGPVGAQPSSDEVRDDLETARERLQELEMRAATAVEDYNEATVALEEASADLEATQQRRDRLADEVEELRRAAGDHARRLHKLGPTLELSSVFVAGDPTELGARTAALGRILDGQRADLEGLEASRVALAATEDRLAAQQEAAEQRAAEVEQVRARVESVLGEQQDEIAELREELESAEQREAAEERRRQARQEARRAAREQAQQAERASESTPPDTSTSDTSTSDTSSSSDTSSERESSSPPPSTRQSASVAVQTALDQVGKPYRYGANGPDAYDCSGLTSYAWRAAGVDITRTSRSQWHATTRVSRSQLQAGDLVFYSRDGTPSGIGHVAMYTGRGGEVVEAPYSGQNVRVRGDGLSRSDILGYGRP